jgi:hypothetical protein
MALERVVALSFEWVFGCVGERGLVEHERLCLALLISLF